MNPRPLIAFACALSTTGCVPLMIMEAHAVRGSGVFAQETRQVKGDFTRVQEDGAANVSIVVGQPTSVKIEGDDNIVPLVKTEVDGDTLRIGMKKKCNLHPNKKLVVTITMPSLNGVQLDGAGNITATNVNSNDLKIGLDGAGNVNVSGSAKKLDASIDGAGNLNLGQLQTVDASVTVDGAGNSHVWATGSLSAEINGVGNIRYKGTPQVSKKIDGVGRIAPE